MNGSLFHSLKGIETQKVYLGNQSVRRPYSSPLAQGLLAKASELDPPRAPTVRWQSNKLVPVDKPGPLFQEIGLRSPDPLTRLFAEGKPILSAQRP